MGLSSQERIAIVVGRKVAQTTLAVIQRPASLSITLFVMIQTMTAAPNASFLQAPRFADRLRVNAILQKLVPGLKPHAPRM